MGSFGGRLQREREMRGISLDEIAEATKIGTRSLRALESEEFEKLPGGIFNKGFVRAYAKYLGIDEEQAVSDYMSAVGEAEQADSAEGAKAPAPKLAVPEVAEDEESKASAAAVVLAIVLVLGGLGYGGWRYYESHGVRAQGQRAATTQAIAPAATQTAASVPQPGAAAGLQSTSPQGAAPDPNKTSSPAPTQQGSASAASAEQKEFELLIRAHQDSWMSITADGKQVMSSLLAAGSEKSVRARDKVILRLGNAGGVEISYNGKAVATAGLAGQTRTLTFTPSGLQQ